MPTTEHITRGKRLCRAYYDQRGLAEQAEAEADAIYYGERDFWDHLAAAAVLAFNLEPGRVTVVEPSPAEAS